MIFTRWRNKTELFRRFVITEIGIFFIFNIGVTIAYNRPWHCIWIPTNGNVLFMPLILLYYIFLKLGQLANSKNSIKNEMRKPPHENNY